ncbi:uncharacterized protein LOC143018023 isoform X2 [Oratosquilla oratoria]|uniref:uncharacterized protein LOC143018023 isoform X2 n=1 Tax=Oratosquilla oratoria TaxID=337810 RepID=UPI003F76A91A
MAEVRLTLSARAAQSPAAHPASVENMETPITSAPDWTKSHQQLPIINGVFDRVAAESATDDTAIATAAVIKRWKARQLVRTKFTRGIRWALARVSGIHHRDSKSADFLTMNYMYEPREFFPKAQV